LIFEITSLVGSILIQGWLGCGTKKIGLEFLNLVSHWWTKAPNNIIMLAWPLILFTKHWPSGVSLPGSQSQPLVTEITKRKSLSSKKLNN
jgi:hypothetical protein